MKTPEQVLADVERRLSRTWADVISGSDVSTWPHEFPLSQPTAAELEADSERYFAQGRQWRQRAGEVGATVRWTARRVHGTPQELPTHLVVDSIDAAAALLDATWPERLQRARRRQQVLAQRYPHVSTQSRTVRAVEALTELDFELLCRAADWFAHNDASGLTPRQVPIAGMHAKWLNTRQGLVRDLSGVDDLKLLPPHPARIHFTYLDPEYRAHGGRLHDSATVGDAYALAYRPSLVVISENKDTALHLPALAGAVSVEGVGKGGTTAAAFEWIRNAEHVVYWGDMDADGFEILDGFRQAGVPATSLLMDLETYRQWQQYGTDFDPKGQPLKPCTPKALPHLTADERELYEALCSPEWPGHRRVEQERIPLAVAHAALQAAHPSGAEAVTYLPTSAISAHARRHYGRSRT